MTPQEPTAGSAPLAAVVVLAAGQGTRMRSTTPKVLIVMIDLSWDYAGSKNNHVRVPVTVMRMPKPASS